MNNREDSSLDAAVGVVAGWLEVDHEPRETREVSVFEGFPREKRLGPRNVMMGRV